jgi:hypothetical protein
MVRSNCADSLDRVNQGTFYTALVCLTQFRHAQPQMDFLAPGNIVSLLSTKSPALKVDAIHAFALSLSLPPPRHR